MIMRRRLEELLTELNNSMIEMGQMVESAISDANKALLEQDVELAKKIIAGDDDVDKKEKDIEQLCLKVLLQQQPVAGDLRAVSAVLKMITDLERIGDHAADISEILTFIAGKPYIKKLEHLPQMAEATMKMLTESIDALVRKDIELARKVIDDDDIVDDLFETIKHDLIVMINENSAVGNQAIDLIMIAKYFERIGDHATNIAEWVIFSLTGEQKLG